MSKKRKKIKAEENRSNSITSASFDKLSEVLADESVNDDEEANNSIKPIKFVDTRFQMLDLKIPNENLGNSPADELYVDELHISQLSQQSQLADLNVGVTQNITLPPQDEIVSDRLDKDLLEKISGYKMPTALGQYVIIRVYVGISEEDYIRNDKGELTNILKSEITKEADLYKTCTGVVMSVGPYVNPAKSSSMKLLEALGKKIKFLRKLVDILKEEEWIKVGQWVSFERHRGMQIKYRDIPLVGIKPGDLVLSTDDPDLIKKW